MTLQWERTHVSPSGIERYEVDGLEPYYFSKEKAQLADGTPTAIVTLRMTEDVGPDKQLAICVFPADAGKERITKWIEEALTKELLAAKDWLQIRLDMLITEGRVVCQHK